MIKERIKNIWKKIKTIRLRGIYFGLFLLCSLLCSLFIQSSQSTYAYAPNTSTGEYWNRYSSVGEWSHGLTSLANPGQTAPGIGWTYLNIGTHYELQEFTYRILPSSSTRALSFTANINVQVIYYNGLILLHGNDDCRWLNFDFDAYSNNALVPIRSTTKTVNLCQPNATYASRLDYNFSITTIFENPSNIDYFKISVRNYDSEAGNFGVLFSCGGGTGAVCNTNGQTGYWNVHETLLDIQYTLDEQTAIMWEQLTIQKAEYNQNQKDRQDIGDIGSSGDEGADSASSDANGITTNFLFAIMYLRDVARSVHTTTCVVNFPSVSFFGGSSFSLGNMDFCSLSVPSVLSNLLSLSVFGFVLFWSYKLLRDFYSLLSTLFHGGSK